MAADGSLKFDTKINTEGFEQGISTLKRAATSITNSIHKTGKTINEAFSGSSAVLNYKAKIEETQRAIKSLEAELEKLNAMPVDNKVDSMKKFKDKINETEDKLDELFEKRGRLENEILPPELPNVSDESKAGVFGRNKEWKKLSVEIAQVEQALADYKKQLHEISATELGEQRSEKYQKIADKIQNLNGKLDTYKKKLEEIQNSENKVAVSNKKMSKSFDGAEKSVKRSYSMFKMLGQSILFSFVFRAINAVTNAVKEGFQNLAQYSGSANTTISSLMSSLTYLKNSLAAGFAPILSVAVPALNALINVIAQAIAWIGQLVAALTGQNTFVRAKKVQEDYAASLKKTGGAAKQAGKDAQKALAPFDDLVQIQHQDNDSGGGGGGAGGINPSDMFETVPVDNGVTAAIDAIKSKLAELSDIFVNGFWDGFGDTSVFDSIKQSIGGIKDSLVDIFTDSAVVGAANNFVETAIYNLGKITGSVASIGASLADNLLGGADKYLKENSQKIKDYLVSMFDIGSRLSDIKGNFAEAWATVFEAFRSDDAKQITADIIGIFMDTIMGVTELCLKLGTDIIDAFTAPFVNNQELIKATLENTFGAVAPIFGEIKSVIEEVFIKLGETYDAHVAPMINSFKQGFSEIAEKALELYNQHILPVISGMATKFAEFRDLYLSPLIDKFLEFAGKVADAITLAWENILKPFILWFMETAAPIIAEFIQGAIDGFLDFWGGISETLGYTYEALSGLIDFIVGIFTGNWELAWEGIKSFFTNVWNAMSTFVATIVEGIKNKISTTLKAIKSTWDSIWGKIKELLGDTWTKMEEAVSGRIETISTAVKGFIEGMQQTFQGLIDFVTGVFTGDWEKAWEGVKDIFKGIFNGIISLVEGAMNFIVDAINSVIDGISGISEAVGDVIGIDLSIPTLSKISLPRLATGTVVPPRAGEFAAILGDNNRETEVVSPLSTIKQALVEALQEAGSIGNGNQTIVLQLNGSVAGMARMLKPELDKEAARKGVKLVVTGG